MRLLYSWDFPRKDTGVGCNFFLSPGDLLTQGSNLYPLHCRQILYNLGHRRACPFRLRAHKKNVLVLILFQNPCRRWDTTLDKFDVAREIATLSILEVTLGVWNSNLLSGWLRKLSEDKISGAVFFFKNDWSCHVACRIPVPARDWTLTLHSGSTAS